jgi:rare lipoprotein A
MTEIKRFHPKIVRSILFAVTLSITLNQGLLQTAAAEELPNPATSGRKWFPENNEANPASSTSARAMLPEESSLVGEGKASYYASKFNGKKTASGEFFSLSNFTAAHRSLPFGTSVRVINLDNGKNVVVRINDRGPYLRGRIIDVSPAAARVIGLFGRGTANVRIEAYTANATVM